MAIIVGLSDSPLGLAAIERASKEAVQRSQPLVLVHHVSARRNEEDSASYPARRREAEDAVKERASELSTGGVQCLPYVPSVPMSASEAVLDAAQEHDAELIVVGIRRRSPVGKVFLGSTSQEILLGADCEVLGVKVPAKDDQSKG